MRTVFCLADASSLRSRWIRIEFSQSFVGQPVRPLLRFRRSGGAAQDCLLPAATFGRARWIGLAPADLVSVDIFAPLGAGQDIRVDRLVGLGDFAVALRVFTRHPSRIPHYLLSRFRGMRQRAVMARTALDLRRTPAFAAFAAERERKLEPDGLDAALCAGVPDIGELAFVMSVAAEGAAGLSRTLNSLAAQHDRAFRLTIALRPDRAASVGAEVGRLGLRECVELVPIAENGAADRIVLGLALRSTCRWVGLLRVGDILDPKAILLLRHYLQANPTLEVLYSDSAEVDRWDGRLYPQLKPDWSPIFLEQVDYVGRLCLFRADVLAEAAQLVDADDTHPWWAALVAAGRRRPRVAFGHLKRVLLRTESEQPRLIKELPTPGLARNPAPPAPLVSIVIPTRDRVELLRRAIDTISAATDRTYPYEVIVVDNGSTSPDSIKYLAGLETAKGFTVVRDPGVFNFSRLVNSGAAAARGDVILLLNNDCEVEQGDWLTRLGGWALQPEVGGVGALLLYEDERIQHAGVSIGMGGEAGHRDRNMPVQGHYGHLLRMKAVHEVSAVTGACLAVDRRKFLEVEGFDEAFAVAFNDVDFCLRLQAKGYQNLLVPQVVLKHLESASRGKDHGPKRVRFLEEAARFRERWRPLVHDDPFYNPLFSTTRFNDWLE